MTFILPPNLDLQSIYELKRIALDELNLTRDQVRSHGRLTCISTWVKAIKATQAPGQSQPETPEIVEYVSYDELIGEASPELKQDIIEQFRQAGMNKDDLEILKNSPLNQMMASVCSGFMQGL